MVPLGHDGERSDLCRQREDLLCEVEQLLVLLVLLLHHPPLLIGKHLALRVRAVLDVPRAVLGIKNRAATLANWTVAFLGRGRRQRTITKQEAFARALGLETPTAKRARPKEILEKTGAR